jgi:hypothetical protein
MWEVGYLYTWVWEDGILGEEMGWIDDEM